MKKKLKSWFKRINPFIKKRKIDLSPYEPKSQFSLLEIYRFDDYLNKSGDLLYVGKDKFVSTEKYFWFHTIDENKIYKEGHRKEGHRKRGKRRHWYYKRRFFHFRNNQEFSIEGCSGKPNSLYVVFDVSGDYNLKFHFWFIVDWWFTIKRLPNWYMNWFKKRLPRYEYSRKIGLSIHDGIIWWNLWADDDSSSSKNKFRKGSFNYRNLIRGKETYRNEYIGFKDYKLFFKEGGYNVVSIKKYWTKRFKRFGFFYNKSGMSYEIINGKFEEIKSPEDIGSYKCVLILSEDILTKRELLLEKKAFIDDNCFEDYEENLHEKTRKFVLNKVSSFNKETKIAKLDNGEEVYWSKIMMIIKEGTGIPDGTGDHTYSIRFGSDTGINSYEDSFGKFYSSIIKDRRNPDWTPPEYRDNND